MTKRKNQFLILHVTSALLALVLTLSFSPIYAQTVSHVNISNPPTNGIVSSGFQVIGNYQSDLKTPTILIELNKVNYTATDNNGIFTYTTSIPDGTYNMVVFMFDSSGTHRTSVQFNQVSGHVSPVKYGLIIPYYSETCQRMVQAGDYSVCPPLKELVSVDTSNQNISGHIGIKKDGTYVRSNPQSRNHYQFYTNMTDKKVCVDCFIDLASGDTVQQVIIEPSGFTHVAHEFHTVTTNETGVTADGTPYWYLKSTNEDEAGMTIYHDWFPDSSCISVMIDYSQERYQDAIDYLKSNCTSHAYNDTTTTVIPYHPFNMSSPFTSLPFDTYKQSIFHGHKDLTNEHMPTGGGLGPGNCINQKCAFSDPYKKKGY